MREREPASRAFPITVISESRHFPFMNSNIILRRFAARSLARHRSLASTAILRLYSTSEEPDPQLNGYPQLPWQSRQDLPPLGWQDNLMRRNFGDTVRLSQYDPFLTNAVDSFTNKKRSYLCGALTQRRSQLRSLDAIF